ncbi:MAG: glycosyltransferase family 4 protein [Chloroflexi bacterium]|nr:glycosyltransferase family 4 protein [Chloroflexota bacterium]
MKIVLDVTPAVQQHAGVGRYAEQLAKALAAGQSGDEVGLFYVDSQGRAPRAPLGALPSRALSWGNKRWRLSALLSIYSGVAVDSMFGDADVFHATDHLLPRLQHVRSVFTLHDTAYIEHPETHLPLNRWFLRLMMPHFLRRADAVICVSQFTKKEAVRRYGLGEAKTYVISEGVDQRFRPVQEPARLAATRARYSLPERFILFVSTIEPRKNLPTLLQAYRALRAEGRAEKLVVVGRKGWLYQDTFSRLRQLGLEGEVVFPGYVADEDLPVFYALASCFCFPSLYEGFGLAPLEAMATGCPVVCSNAASLPEVCGDAAVLVPPKDLTALVAALRRVLDDPALREVLGARGLQQAGRFKWEDAAQKTLDVYRAVFLAEGH